MNPINITYEISRCYVQDHRYELDEQTYSKILGWIRSRDLARLASCRDHLPNDNIVKGRLKVLMQIEAFFKKNAAFAELEKCSQAAKDSFERAELICRITNKRLDFYYANRDRLDPDISFWMSRAEAYVSKVLGPFDDFLDSLPKMIRVTSGATSTRSRRQSIPFLKISKKPVCTAGALPYLQALSRFYGYGELKGKLVTSNRVEVVPKNWKTSRTIACEPEGNIPLQLAFDEYVKGRLRRFGIDLSDQSRNQRMAYDGSVWNCYSTIDLSMASDTVAYNTVAWMLPHPWFRYLDAVRSPNASGKFGNFHYAKFSSMGNGATFALETLIFAAACYAIGSKSFSVYGDDIIVERWKAQSLLRLLRFLGFHVNQDKSYIDGLFKESCGTNWFFGSDITPFYLRKWSRIRAEICHNVNGLAALSYPGGRLWKLLSKIISDNKLPLVPWNNDSLSGIFIDIPTSYQLRLISHKHWVLKFRSYRPCSKTRRNRDSRSLFLWYLQKYRTEHAVIESSRYTTPSHKYVRKWVHWIPPMAGTPVHLYRWTDFLLHSKS